MRLLSALLLLPIMVTAISYRGCTNDQQVEIMKAAQYAERYINNAQNYFRGISSGTPRYTTWFGAYTDSHKSLVWNHFEKIGHSLHRITYDCSCTAGHNSAYVYPDNPSTIYLCSAFWSAPLSGTDSQAGILLRLSTKFSIHGGTKDYASGQSACKQLAINKPDEAVMNADSHQYFAENNPYQQ